jgi:hypothetical protein
VGHHRPTLTPCQIVAWADAHHHRTGRWPRATSGPVAEAPGLTWRAVNAALFAGLRGLPGGSSLARLLAHERGVRGHKHRPRLAIADILRWADSHHERTGRWPSCSSGAIPEAPGTTWRAVDMALRQGNRGLPGGASLNRLLHDHRGIPLRTLGTPR